MKMILRTHNGPCSSCWLGGILSRHRLGWSHSSSGLLLGCWFRIWSRTNSEPRLKSHMSHRRLNRHFETENRMQNWVE